MTNKKSNIIQFPSRQKENDYMALMADLYGLPIEEYRHLSGIMDNLSHLPDSSLSALYRWLRGILAP